MRRYLFALFFLPALTFAAAGPGTTAGPGGGVPIHDHGGVDAGGDLGDVSYTGSITLAVDEALLGGAGDWGFIPVQTGTGPIMYSRGGAMILIDTDNDQDNTALVVGSDSGTGTAATDVWEVNELGIVDGIGDAVLTKSADQNFTSTTLANVSDLSFAVAADGKYKVDCVISVRVSVTTAGVKLGATAPAGTNRPFLYSIFDPSGTNNIVRSSSVDLGSCGDGGLSCEAHVRGVLHVGGTAGTFSIQAARSGGAGTTTIEEESMCTVRRGA